MNKEQASLQETRAFWLAKSAQEMARDNEPLDVCIAIAYAAMRLSVMAYQGEEEKGN